MDAQNRKHGYSKKKVYIQTQGPFEFAIYFKRVLYLPSHNILDSKKNRKHIKMFLNVFLHATMG